MLISSKFIIRKLGTTPGISPAAAFTVFQPCGMLMAKPVPLTLAEIPVPADTTSAAPPTTIAREGFVSLVLMPPVTTDEKTIETDKSASFYDKEKRVSIKLRARQIGQIISWKNSSLGISSFNAYNTASPIPSQVAVEMKAVVSSKQEQQEPMIQFSVTSSGQQLFTMPIPVGEFKAFQILLEAALPHLYGWIPKQQPSSSFYNNKSNKQSSLSKSPEDFFKQFQTN